MLRMVQFSLVVCVALLFSTGCNMFGKKPANAAAQDSFVDSYVPPTYEDTMPVVDTYQPAPTTTISEPAYLASAGSVGSRYHTVARKDTLYGLARTYYNDPAKWRDIYDANRAMLSDPNRIRVGQRLVIP